MFTRILRRDLRKNRVITGIIAVFIAMASMLAVSGAKTLAELMASMNGFFEKVELPDYMQMHAGETVDLTAVASFSESLDYVKDYQIAEMLTVDSSKLYLNGQSQAATVMDISLVKQNTGFDFLLDMDNERAAIFKGGIGVSVYY